MSKLSLDSQRIEIPCPHCAHKIGQTIGQLKGKTKLVCPACRKNFELDQTNLRSQIAKLEKTLAELNRTISRIGK
jgi:DNA-directed RNA polymerase subunit RPC12/RpoP